MPHFTYCKPKEPSDLQQGDILLRSDELDSLIKMYHPYYNGSKFIGFMVTTQSCDLVRRGGASCSAAYIGLAAIKPFSKVMDRELEKHQNDLLRAAEAISTKSKDRVLQVIERLLNNNHPDYFYLHEDVANGLSDRLCAYLRVTISIKSEHYETCLKARRLCLSQGFQAKLGWLLGNLYSRVGTEDWVPDTKSPPEWASLLNDVLIESVAVIDDKQLTAAKKELNLNELAGIPSEEVRKRINSIVVPRRKDSIIDAMLEQIRKDKMLGEEDLKKLKVRLGNNPALATLVK